MGVGSNRQIIELNAIIAYNQYTIGNYFNIGSIYSLNPFDLLGKGAFGQVYTGKNIYTNENVAIKIESTRKKILFFLMNIVFIKIYKG